MNSSYFEDINKILWIFLAVSMMTTSFFIGVGDSHKRLTGLRCVSVMWPLFVERAASYFLLLAFFPFSPVSPCRGETSYTCPRGASHRLFLQLWKTATLPCFNVFAAQDVSFGINSSVFFFRPRGISRFRTVFSC